ncbi:hypothetical protein B0A55_08155 [Friedmanniomyces simplex]|uniref:Uncharacterized protein n=1 Tax=Friedmanniomyces simplex TaxID=329884 RepID=A0A4U0WXN7_9PEZI|nr:hypothetical protein B0A55_08155 [Friedmanniomyces simplex]
MGPRKPKRAKPVVTVPEPQPEVHEMTESEREYHTEASDASASEADEPVMASAQPAEAIEGEDGSESEVMEEGPYLPAHLLKAPVPSDLQVIPTPWEELSRKQKQGQRRTNRQLKKRQWDQLRTDAEASGVLQAGKAAQVKRGVVMMSDRVRSGRVGKKSKVRVEVSGRQRMLEERKRARGGSRVVGASKKAKTKSTG